MTSTRSCGYFLYVLVLLLLVTKETSAATTTPIPDCTGMHCVNGDCPDGVTCVCFPGYQGQQCTRKIICSDCGNDVTCTAGQGQQPDICNCAAGYTGSTCEVGIDECDSSPCQHGWTCTDLVNMYTCDCTTGYGGDHCEAVVGAECTSSPCQNGGTCIQGQSALYSCACVAGYTGTHCGTITLTGVHPTVGPRSGGTLVTITGAFVEINFVTIGQIPCPIKERTAESYVCLSGPLTDVTQVNESLDVIVYNGPIPIVLHTGYKFKYQADPVIFLIEPLESIESGGALLTVTGQNFDIVGTTLMVTHVRSLVSLKEYSTETNCTVESSSEMLCPTPEINVDLLTRKRKRRQTSTTLNVRENIEVEISFRLDGVLEYRNLSVGNLTEYSKITVYADPIIISFSPSVQIFTSTWPLEQRYLEIKGKTLLNGLRQDAYIVRIGEAVCANIDVHDNLITCEPPKMRPQVSVGDYVGDNRIPVKVLFASKVGLVGHLNYRQTLWEYPPAQYGIIASLCAVVIIIIIIVTCLYKRRPSTHNDLAARGFPVHPEGINLAQRVRRWSRKSPKRFSSFIPTGTRLPMSGHIN